MIVYQRIENGGFQRSRDYYGILVVLTSLIWNMDVYELGEGLVDLKDLDCYVSQVYEVLIQSEQRIKKRVFLCYLKIIL